MICHLLLLRMDKKVCLLIVVYVRNAVSETIKVFYECDDHLLSAKICFSCQLNHRLYTKTGVKGKTERAFAAKDL